MRVRWRLGVGWGGAGGRGDLKEEAARRVAAEHLARFRGRLGVG